MRRSFRYISVLAAVALLFTAQALPLRGEQREQAAANTPVVRAWITPDSMSIGDHFRLRVEIDKDMMQVVNFPTFDKKLRLAERMVFLEEYPADTIASEGRRQTISKEYRFTCFIAGEYNLGRFPILYGDKNIVDTLYSDNRLSLLVTTFKVDTVGSTIYDIKRPEETPLLVSEFSGYLKWAIVALCLLAAIIWLVSHWMSSRRKQEGAAERTRPRELPHVRAIRELEALHNQKVWQNNKPKLYYSRLTDIIRTYIEGRYGIGAMEMTTDEIMAAMEGAGLSDKSYRDLREMLRIADLVKFARHIPEGDENERIYHNAYYFVEETKELPEEENEKNKPAEEKGDE